MRSPLMANSAAQIMFLSGELLALHTVSFTYI